MNSRPRPKLHSSPDLFRRKRLREWWSQRTDGICPARDSLRSGQATRPNPYLGSANVQTSVGTSSYNALQLDLTQRLSKGLQFRANYTWSKNMDIGSEPGSVRVHQFDAPRLSNLYNPKADWGPSSSDATNVASISG